MGQKVQREPYVTAAELRLKGLNTGTYRGYPSLKKQRYDYGTELQVERVNSDSFTILSHIGGVQKLSSANFTGVFSPYRKQKHTLSV